MPPIPAFILDDIEGRWAHTINLRLSDLSNFHQRFLSALDLIEFCEQRIAEIGERVRDHRDLVFSPADQRLRFAAWSRIAERDCAITVYDFAQALHQIMEAVNKHCPTIKPLLTRRRLHQALEQFQRRFPDAKNIRDAAAHPEAFGRPDSWDRNAFTGGYERHGLSIAEGASGNVIQGSSGRHVFYTFGGKILSCEINSDAAACLAAAATEFQAAFEDAIRNNAALFEPMYEAYGRKSRG